jgi:predicted ATP-grasp superfamily ATP-dependent carboligase
MRSRTSSRRVLVLDAGAPAGTVAVQSLGKRLEVHGAGKRRPLAYGSRRLSLELLYPDGMDEPRLLDWIRELDEAYEYSLIIPATEVSLRIMQRLPDGDELRRRAVMPARASVAIALDKIETCRLAQRLGIRVPESEEIEGPTGRGPARSFPVVLKSSRSLVVRDGRLTYAVPRIARDDAERTAFLDEWQEYTDVQEQEYFPGWGVGIECLYDRGKLRWAFAHQRIHELPLTGGGSSYRRSIPCPPELLDCTERLLDELEWHGVAMVEFRVNDEGGFVLLEVNPRLWGSLPLAVRSGVDFPQGLFRLATREDLIPQPAYRVGYRMRHFERDVEWMWANWSADHDDPFLLTRPRVQSVLQWLLPLTGREGWDLVHWSDPAPFFVQCGHIIKRLTKAVRVRLSAR